MAYQEASIQMENILISYSQHFKNAQLHLSLHRLFCLHLSQYGVLDKYLCLSKLTLQKGIQQD